MLTSVYLELPLPKSTSVKVLQTPSLSYFVDIIREPNGRPLSALTQKNSVSPNTDLYVNFFTDRCLGTFILI